MTDRLPLLLDNLCIVDLTPPIRDTEQDTYMETEEYDGP